MKLNVFKKADEAMSALADFFVVCANEAITKNDKFSVALSGGNSPKKLFELLASADYSSKLDWA